MFQCIWSLSLVVLMAFTGLVCAESPYGFRPVEDMNGWPPEARRLPPEIRAHLRLLKRSFDVSIQKQAARDLGKYGRRAEGAVPVLLEILRDHKRMPSLRSEVLETLLQIGPHGRAAVPILKDMLRDEDPSVREWAARSLDWFEDSAVQAAADLLVIATATITGSGTTAALREHIQDLHDSSPVTRRAAIWKIGELGPNAVSAIPHLIRLLSHPDFHNADEAAEALGKIGSPAVSALVPFLGSRDQPTRARVCRALQSMGQPAADAVPALTNLLEEKDSVVVEAAADALGVMGARAKSAVPQLIAVFKRFASSRAAAAALGALGADASAAVPTLIEALGDREMLVRCRAAEALGRIGSKASQAIPALSARTVDWHAPVREAAFRALGRMGTTEPRIISVVEQGLADGDLRVRRSALYALRNLGSRLPESTGSGMERIAAIQRAGMNEPDPAVRLDAVIGLGELRVRDELSIDTLVRSLRDADPRIRATAAWSLGFCVRLPQPDIQALEMSLKDRDLWVKRCALWTLGKTHPETLIEHAGRLRAEDPDLWRSALWMLSLRSSDLAGARPCFQLAFSDPDPIARWIAVEAFGRVKSDPQGTVARLAPALRDPDPYVRVAAAVSLGAIGTRASSAIPLLARQLRDSERLPRLAAVWALGALGPASRSVMPDLMKALRDTDSGMQALAAQALGRIGRDARPALPILEELFRRPLVGRCGVDVWPRRQLDSKYIPRTIAALKNPEASQRINAAWTLGAAKSSPTLAVPALIYALRDTDAHVRTAAANSLGSFGSAARMAEYHLVSALKDPDLNVRATAAASLTALSSSVSESVRVIVDLLWAARPLGTGPGAVWMARMTNLQTSMRRVALLVGWMSPQSYIVLAEECHRLTSRLAVHSLAAILRWGDPIRQDAAATVLGTITPQAGRAVPALIQALGPVSSLRITVAETLGKLGPAAASAVPTLLDIANSDPVAGPAAGAAVIRLGRAAVPILVEVCVRYQAGGIEHAAVTLLERMDTIAHFIAAGLLRATLRHGDSQARLGAACLSSRLPVLAHLTVPELVTALSDPSFLVRYRAALALVAAGPRARQAIPALIETVIKEEIYLGTSGGVERIEGLPVPRLPALANALHDPRDTAVAARALKEIGGLGERAGVLVPQLLQVMYGDVWASDAASALSKIGPVVQVAVPEFAAAARGHANGDVRNEANWLLELLGPETGRVIPVLLAAGDRNRRFHLRNRALAADSPWPPESPCASLLPALEGDFFWFKAVLDLAIRKIEHPDLRPDSRD